MDRTDRVQPVFARLSFRPTERPPARLRMQNGPDLDILIDGLPLTDAVGGLPVGVVGVLSIGQPAYQADSARRLLGLAAPDIPPDRVALYVCGECGDLGCGAITTRLTIDKDRVTWDRFMWERQPEIDVDRTEHGSVGSFVFERHAYETGREGRRQLIDRELGGREGIARRQIDERDRDVTTAHVLSTEPERHRRHLSSIDRQTVVRSVRRRSSRAAMTSWSTSARAEGRSGSGDRSRASSSSALNAAYLAVAGPTSLASRTSAS